MVNLLNNHGGSAGSGRFPRFRRRSFTFIEVMTACSILAVGIISVAQVFFSSINAGTHINNRIHAGMIIESERWRIFNFLKANPDTDDYVDKKALEGVPDFNVTVSLRKREGTLGLYDINIEVSWMEGIKLKRIKRSFFARG